MKVDRTRPPGPGALPAAFRFPAFHRHRLDNGLEILVLPRPGIPLVDLRLLLPAGGREGIGRPPGLPGLHAALLDEGIPDLDAAGIARRIEAIGGALSTGADSDLAWASAGGLVEHLPDMMALVAEVVRRPTFPEEELDRLRSQWKAEIERRRSQASDLANAAFLREVYGETPYGHPTIGTVSGLDAIDRPLLIQFHEERIRPNGSTLIAVGDTTMDDVVELARAFFDDWKDTGRPSETIPEPPTLDETHIVIVDRPRAQQTEMVLGHASVDRSYPKVPALLLLSGILGGKFTSRLNLVLREEMGATYGVRSRFDLRRGPGPFRVTAAISTDAIGASLARTLEEIERLRREKTPANELRETQDYLVGTFPYSVQTLGGLANRLETLVLHDLPDDTYATYPALLRDVTAEEVRQAAKAETHPDHAAIVLAGPADQLRPQIESMAPVRVIATEELF